MRYVFEPSLCDVRARIRAFLHEVTAETNDIRGWLDIAQPDDPLQGPIDGVAEVAAEDFRFANALLARSARRWVRDQRQPVIRFELLDADGTETDVRVAGNLTVAQTTRTIHANARLVREGDHLAVVGQWPLRRREFGVTAPAGVDDRVDVEFLLVARPDGQP